ncbi:hypothetical protein AMECASPLE_023056 [Ameca splendens]|uniref:Uncharacterized protein n=1 Tax=Ameca splendens TaxID=208324 RepID=A0ABV0Y453_9TELE
MRAFAGVLAQKQNPKGYLSVPLPSALLIQSTLNYVERSQLIESTGAPLAFFPLLSTQRSMTLGLAPKFSTSQFNCKLFRLYILISLVFECWMRGGGGVGSGWVNSV